MSTKIGDSLALTNAIIGLTRSDGLWPDTLARLGYHVFHIERRLVTGEGEYCADLILKSSTHNHALVSEVKCGTVQTSQHRALLAVNADALRDAGLKSADWSSFAHDVAYWSVDDFAERLRQGFSRQGWAPLITVGDDVIALVEGSFASEPLDTILRSGIPVSGLNPPLGYVPFDSESSDRKIAREILATVLSCLRHGDPWLPFDEFVAKCHPYWSKLGQRVRGPLGKRIESLLKSAIRSTLAPYIVLRTEESPHRIGFLKDLSAMQLNDLRRELTRYDGAVRQLLYSLDARDDEQLSLFDAVSGQA
jgi:hypothetical protein